MSFKCLLCNNLTFELFSFFGLYSNETIYGNNLKIGRMLKHIFLVALLFFSGSLLGQYVAIDSNFNSTDVGFGRGDGANAQIFSSACQSDGKIVIGGFFTSYNGQLMNRIARLEVNGLLDSTFQIGTGADDIVNEVLIQPDGKILICGSFSSYNGVTRNKIARLNTDGSLDLTFNPGLGTNAPISTMALRPNGQIIIGGFFTLCNGIVRNGIAQLNSSGALDVTFNPGLGQNGDIYSIGIQPDGKAVIGGTFTSYTNVNRNRLARINLNGSLDISFNIGSGVQVSNFSNCFVSSLVIQPDGKIVFGGEFNNFNGFTVSDLARVDSTGAYDFTFNHPLVSSNNNGGIGAILLLPNGQIIAGRAFTSNGNNIPKIVRLNANGSMDPTFFTGVGFQGNMSTMSLQSDGKILFAGVFVYYNERYINNMARLNGNGTPDDFNIHLGTGLNGYGPSGWNYYGLARTIAVQPDGKILIGGTFGQVNGVSKGCIARLFADGTLDTTFNTGTINDGNWINIITVQPDGKILVGGIFQTFNGVTTGGLVRLNSDGSLDNTFSVSIPYVNTISLQSDGKIITNGFSFSSPIVRLNTDGSIDNTFALVGSNAIAFDVYSTVIQPDGKIIMAGNYLPFTGSSSFGITRLNPNGTVDFSFNPGAGANGTVIKVLLQPDGKVVLLGGFSTINGVPRNCFARLNANGTLDAGFNSSSGSNNFNIIETGFLQLDGKIVVGGGFTDINGIPANRMARLNTNGSVDLSFNLGSGFDDYVYASALQPDGKILVGGNFTEYDGTGRNRIARLIPQMPDASISLGNISGQDSCDNRDLTVDFTLQNFNSSGSLPSGTPVSFFVNDSIYVSTIYTNDTIAIGDSLQLIATISIPAGISSPFVLNIVANQDSTQAWVLQESDFTNNTLDTVLSFIQALTPVFDTIAPICPGEVLILPTVSDNGIFGFWSPAPNSNQTTTYSFTEINNACITETNLTVSVLPISQSYDTILFCESGLPLVWNGQNLSVSTTATALLQDQNGCDSVANLNFQVIPIQYSSFSVQICDNDPDYLWAGVSYNQTGSYTQTFTAQSGCDSIVTLNLTVRPAPIATFSMEPLIGCLPIEVTFSNDNPVPNLAVSWDFGNGQTSTGSTNVTATYTQAGCYDVSLTVTNPFGCTQIQNQMSLVCVEPDPIASFSPQNNPLPLIAPTTILQNNSTNAYSWQWNFGDGNVNSTDYSPEHTFPEQAGSYVVKLYVETESGCSDSTERTIVIEQDPLLYVPNAFTPDENEFNDMFLPVFSDKLMLSQFEMRIYNRWGELIFQSLDPKIGWDGTYGGKPAPDGVYTYRVDFAESGFSKVFQLTGSVVLVR